MSINFKDLWIQISTFIGSESGEGQNLQQKIHSLCVAEYETQEAAFAALNRLRLLVIEGVQNHTITCVPGSQFLRGVDTKIQALVNGRGEDEALLFSLPLELLEQILAAVGVESYKATEVCQYLKASTQHLNLHHAFQLKKMDASSGLISTLGISFPKRITAANASKVLKKVYQTLIIVFRNMLDDPITKGVLRELIQDPHALEVFLKKYDYESFLGGLERLAGVPEGTQSAESRILREQWILESDLGKVIAAHTFPHPTLMPKNRGLPSLSLGESVIGGVHGGMDSFLMSLSGSMFL